MSIFHSLIEEIDRSRFIQKCSFVFSNLLAKRWQCGPNGIYSHPKYDKLLSIEIDFDRLIKYIIYAGNKMSQSGYQTEIGEFISMININGYYQN